LGIVDIIKEHPGEVQQSAGEKYFIFLDKGKIKSSLGPDPFSLLDSLMFTFPERRDWNKTLCFL
jgi:hypothetical protein